MLELLSINCSCLRDCRGATALPSCFKIDFNIKVIINPKIRIIFAITDRHAEAPVRGNVGRESVGTL